MTILSTILLTIHSFAFWGNGGYHSMPLSKANAEPSIRSLGGAAADIGIGYRGQKNGFVWQIGTEIGYRYTAFKESDFAATYRMQDTELQPVQVQFAFSSIRETLRLSQANLSLQAGYETRTHYYLLLGTRLGYTLHTSGNIQSVVRTLGNYDEFIGLDGNGLFADMPDHFFSSQSYTGKTSHRLTSLATFTLETGYHLLLSNRQKSQHSLTIGLFAEYGWRWGLSSTSPTSLATYPASADFYPHANAFVGRNNAAYLSQLQVGVRLTYIISQRQSYDCRCE